MIIKSGDLLASHYYVVDKMRGNRIEQVFWADDKTGIYKTYQFGTPGLNIGINMRTDDYIYFVKQHSIKFVGKNWFFKLLKIFLK